MTPAQQDATFTLAFKATDAAGNVTSVSSDFTLDYVNQAPVVMGIESAYTLTQGQNTQIVGLATDAEGDDITWSFETGDSTDLDQLFVSAIGVNGYQGEIYAYNPKI